MALACFAIFVIHGGQNEDGYPAYGRAAEWDIAWMWPIIARNLIAAWAICISWDYILYFSPLTPFFKPYKLNPEYPTLD